MFKKPPSPELILAESQLEMLLNFQQDAMQSCSTKCINKDFKESQLSTSEKQCTDRCLSKFFKVNEIVQQVYLQEMNK